MKLRESRLFAVPQPRDPPMPQARPWNPFNSLQFCQPIVNADEERRALVATAAFLRAERRNSAEPRELEASMVESELNRHFDRRFASHRH
jgi:hypothetical protein